MAKHCTGLGRSLSDSQLRNRPTVPPSSNNPLSTRIVQTNTEGVVSPTIIAKLANGPDSQHYFPLPNVKTKLIGDWPDSRASLVAHILKNLRTLTNVPKGECRAQLQREINQYWNCLSDKQKVEALNTIGGQLVMCGQISPALTPEEAKACGLAETFADMPKNERVEALKDLDSEQKKRFLDHMLHGPAISWLHSMLTHRNAAVHNGLSLFLKDDAKANIRAIATKKPDRSFVDIDLDYKKILKYRNIDGSLPSLPLESRGKRVAIIGSGVAGTIAAREALAMGLCPVIFEAEDHIGGRLESLHYKNEDGSQASEFSEMGAMRFPRTGRSWLYLLNKVAGVETKHVDGKTTAPAFPNPGIVPTKLFLDGEIINWPAGAPAPESDLLKKVKGDFEKFAESLMAPLEDARRTHDTEKKEEIWQSYIDQYKDESFYAAVMDGMKKSGADWGEDEKNAFAALGIGTGGLGPLYTSGFLEILRVMVNKLESDQELLPMGTTAALDKFYKTEVTDPDGKKVSLQKDVDIRFSTKVTGISSADGKPTLEFQHRDGSKEKEEFDAVVVATTSRAMEHITGLLSTNPASALLDKKVASAIPKLRMISSSKLFIRTEKKFWLDENGKPRADIPQVILTDRGPCNVFCLDYDDFTDHGIVAVSYTWGDASIKLQGMSPKKRFEECKNVIQEVSPEFAQNLVPVNGEIHCVDWQARDNQHGAFKMLSPGQEESQKELYHHYLDVTHQGDKPHSGVFLAGDTVGYCGGWAETAVISSVNAVLAIASHFGGTPADDSPLKQDKDKYNYGGRRRQ